MYQSVTKSNPCPICQGTKDCRHGKAFGKVFAHCHSNISGEAEVVGWLYKKPSSNGVWGVYEQSSGLSDRLPPRRRFLSTKPSRTAATKVAEPESKTEVKEKVFSVDFGKFFAQENLGLAPADVADLNYRGLRPESAKYHRFCTVRRNEKASWILGRNTDDKWSSPTGMLIPCRSYSGEVIGAQLKPHDAGKRLGGGRVRPKYLWLSSYDSATGAKVRSSHIDAGGDKPELPLNYAKPEALRGAHPHDIEELWFCEGTLKPIVACERHNRVFVGAAGGAFSSSPLQVQKILATHPNAKIVFAPDAGSTSNDHVFKQNTKTLALLGSRGHAVFVADWGQGSDKTKGDIDEIDDVTGVRLLNANAYALQKCVTDDSGASGYDECILTTVDRVGLPGRRIGVPANFPVDLLESVVEHLGNDDRVPVIDGFAPPHWVSQAAKAGYAIRVNDTDVDLGLWLNRRSFTLSQAANTEVITDSKYFPDLNPAKSAKLLALKGRQGTGKTQSIRRLLKRLGSPSVLALSHRVTLVSSLCRQFDCEDIASIQGFGLSGVSRLGLCIDSIHKINPDDFTGGVVVIDEVRQVLQHAIFAKTDISKRRTKALDIFANVLRNAALVVVADADLSDLEIDHLQKLIGVSQSETEVIVHGGKPAAGRKLYVAESAEDLLADLRATLTSGGRVHLCTTGQKVESRLGSRNLELWVKQNFPNLKVLRIDQESHGDKNHAAFQSCSKINEVAKANDVIISSPTMGTGVSIEADTEFAKVYAISTGVLSPEDVLQQVERVRYGCDRVLFAAKNAAMYRRGNGATTASRWLSEEKAAAKRSLEHQLGRSDARLEEVSGVSRLWLGLAANYAALQNAYATNYRSNVISLLKRLGYEIAETELSGGDKGIKDETKNIKTDSTDRHLEAVAQARKIDEEEAKMLREATGLSEADRLALERYDVQHSVGISDEAIPCEDPAGLRAFKALVRDSRDGRIRELRLRYTLGVGEDAERAKATLLNLIRSHRDPRGACSNDFLLDKKTTTRLPALRASGIDLVLQSVGKTLELDSPVFAEVSELHKSALAVPGYRSSLPGLSRGGQNAASSFKALAKAVGLKVERKRVYTDGERRTFYLVSEPSFQWLNSEVNRELSSVSDLFDVWRGQDTEALESLGDKAIELYPGEITAPVEYQEYEQDLWLYDTGEQLREAFEPEQIAILRAFASPYASQYLMALDLEDDSFDKDRLYRLAPPTEATEAQPVSVRGCFDAICSAFRVGKAAAQSYLDTIGQGVYNLVWSALNDGERRLIDNLANQPRPAII